ncbi:hypothetical protein CBOM_07089 [Ceraceosorus bombacis]|uniref:Uncharacterized protein n=1 Tax=Ceraceosorus bombacis TaxID=401625 RepID=A0A0P1BKA6_9BASI|nr:hypothetical protein CBOM_07089 [Ceraceosorus bombacis]
MHKAKADEVGATQSRRQESEPDSTRAGIAARKSKQAKQGHVTVFLATKLRRVLYGRVM